MLTPQRIEPRLAFKTSRRCGIAAACADVHPVTVRSNSASERKQTQEAGLETMRDGQETGAQPTTEKQPSTNGMTEAYPDARVEFRN
jgi:hypothetical protein